MNSRTAVEDLLKSTDLIAQLLDENDIDFEGFDAQEFLRDTVPVIVETIVDETAQRVYRRMFQEYMEMDPNNSRKMRTYFEGLIDPDYDLPSEDDWVEPSE